jgi:hypothetical protein
MPVRASYMNREFLWIVLDGEYVGRHCKAVYALLEPKAGKSSVLFVVAFAHIVTGERGKRVTVVNTPREEQTMREDLIGVIFQTKAQRRAELDIYLGVIGMQKTDKER